jgi:uncharacterized cupin superfamily protein
MKTYQVRKALPPSGEYILGAQQTGSHACYLIYGTMQPKEKGRELKPGKGHEELFLALKGDFAVTGHVEGTVKEGEAIYLVGDETSHLENRSDSEAVYVIAGGHSAHGHH